MDTGVIFRGEHKTIVASKNMLADVSQPKGWRHKEVLNMSKDCGVQEKWSIGDRIEGVCACDSRKKVVLEVTVVESNWIGIKNLDRPQDIDPISGWDQGFSPKRDASSIHDSFINPLNKYRYKKLPRESEINWQVGDILRGECRCDSSKTIDFEYLGDIRFLEVGKNRHQVYYNMKATSPIQDILTVLYIPNMSDYTNWRRVPKYNTFWTKEREDSVNLHGSSSLDASDWPAHYSMDYEFGDTIKVRGFEYEIKAPVPCESILHLAKKEPPKPKKIITCEYQANSSTYTNRYVESTPEFFEVRFRLSEDSPEILRLIRFDVVDLDLCFRLNTHLKYYEHDKPSILLGSDSVGNWSNPIIIPKHIKEQLDSICAEAERVLTEEANKNDI